MSDWTEPGAFDVAPGVHRIPLPLPMDGLRAVNVYAIDNGDGLTLIDGGWAIDEARTQLERALASIDRKVEDITAFLVTHMHRDHYTQAVTVRREFGSHVSLGLGEKPSLDLIHDRAAEDPNAAMLRRAGAAELATRWLEAKDQTQTPDPSIWAYPDTWLEDDQQITVGTRTLDAVSTPGHTQGHFVFADKAQQLLFAGDHVLPTITPSIGFEPSVPDQPLGDFLNSLAKVRALPDMALLPAHGAVTASTHARVDELIAHHEQRLDLCRDVVAKNPGTSYDVAAQLPWTRRERRLSDLDAFNQALATMETRAHLELLVARSEMAASESDGVVVYASV